METKDTVLSKGDIFGLGWLSGLITVAVAIWLAETIMGLSRW